GAARLGPACVAGGGPRRLEPRGGPGWRLGEATRAGGADTADRAGQTHPPRRAGDRFGWRWLGRDRDRERRRAASRRAGELTFATAFVLPHANATGRHVHDAERFQRRVGIDRHAIEDPDLRHHQPIEHPERARRVVHEAADDDRLTVDLPFGRCRRRFRRRRPERENLGMAGGGRQHSREQEQTKDTRAHFHLRASHLNSRASRPYNGHRLCRLWLRCWRTRRERVNCTKRSRTAACDALPAATAVPCRTGPSASARSATTRADACWCRGDTSAACSAIQSKRSPSSMLIPARSRTAWACSAATCIAAIARTG